MAWPPVETISIEGFTKLARALKALHDGSLKELKKAAKAGAELVATEARGRAPQVTGTLAGKIKTSSTMKGASVRFGPLVYLKPIVFGWPRHNIEPNRFPFEALDAKREEVVQLIGTAIRALVARTFTPGTGGAP